MLTIRGLSELMSSNCEILFFIGGNDKYSTGIFHTVEELYTALEYNPNMYARVCIDEITTTEQYEVLRVVRNHVTTFIMDKLDNCPTLHENVQKTLLDLAANASGKSFEAYRKLEIAQTQEIERKKALAMEQAAQEKADHEFAMLLAAEERRKVDTMDIEADRKLAMRLAAEERGEVDMMEIETSPRPLYSQAVRGNKSHAPRSAAAASSSSRPASDQALTEEQRHARRIGDFWARLKRSEEGR